MFGLGSSFKAQAVLKSALAFTFCQTLLHLLCIRAEFHEQQGDVYIYLGPSPVSHADVKSLLISQENMLASQGSFHGIISQISLVNFWLACWFVVDPNQDCNLRFTKLLASISYLFATKMSTVIHNACGHWVGIGFFTLHLKPSEAIPPMKLLVFMAFLIILETTMLTEPEGGAWQQLQTGTPQNPTFFYLKSTSFSMNKCFSIC